MHRCQTSSLQQNFIVNELMVLAWAASVQRADIYKNEPKPTDSQIQRFRKSIFNFIQNILPQYVAGCDEHAHIANLLALAEHASAVGVEILADGRYRVGVAQKLLNLALKYFWCGGFIAKPPHCPVDRIMLEMGGSTNICWTQMRSIDEYLLAIRELRHCADAERQSLADWELNHYRRRAGNYFDIGQVLTVRDSHRALVA
ncbi:hypothetical protein [Burkholderia pseudomallei]|uniref:hypothetical protein n=1 Tax=Burkholderia pseudomallei TaxID=28450 RepID=UPI0021F6D860|nr:hypothetical protein [Burkholderia pseudomallei]MCW0131865.1 hypothetical protein [Burkholderia pseudomallei]